MSRQRTRLAFRLEFAWRLALLGRVRSLAPSFLLLVLAVFVVGCRHAAPHLTRLPEVQAPAAPSPAPSREPPSQPTPEPAPLPLPPLPPPTPAKPPEVVSTKVVHQGWVPIAVWASECGLDKLPAARVGTNTAITLRHPKGPLVLTLGRQQCWWAGAEFWLAFPPQVVSGKGSVHALDIDKTLAPLLQENGEAVVTNGVVVIDPGHGGANPGAQNIATGHWEKEYTLDWARRLKPLLEQQGWQVAVTRTNDTEVSLADRVAMADRYQAGVFLSLHFNHASKSPGEAGLETYCITPAGLPSNVTRGLPDNPHEVVPNNAFDDQNLRLALRLQRALVRHSAGLDRGVRRARFLGVLRGQNRPAVLIEGGYLSNPREARLIASPEYRQQLAAATAEALEPDSPHIRGQSRNSDISFPGLTPCPSTPR